MSNYNAIDLFCGCGGLSYGFEKAGFNILLGIDNDSKALEVFEKNHNNAKSICGDITEINYDDIKEKIGDQQIDIIIGGPPCQGMSLSGPRKFDDPRNKLYLSYIRLVDQIRPKAFVIENVPGLVSLFGGQIKDSIIEKFTAMGYTVKYQILYDVKYTILNAAMYGVPQKRERVIIVGFRKDLNIDFQFPEAVICDENEFQPLGSVLQSDVGEKYFFSDRAVAGMMRNRESMNKGRAQDVTRPCNTVGAHLAKVSLNSTDPVLMVGNRYRRFTPREVARIQSFPENFELLGSEGAQYRALGNAIPPVMFWYVAKAVADILI